MEPDDRPNGPFCRSPGNRPTPSAVRRALDEDPDSIGSPILRRLREIGLSREEIVKVLLFLAEAQER
jgi:hypothetical protein